MNVASAIFEGIDEAYIAKMLVCFSAESRTFSANNCICDFQDGTSRIGILSKGSAVLERVDYNGDRTILEYLTPSSVFGDIFAFTGTSNSIYVMSETRCEVTFIDYHHFTKRCEKACPQHSILLQNILKLVSQKVLNLSEKVNILSHKSIRGKLLCYFFNAAQISKYFELPFSFSELADYICVDRSAMMRELSKMKKEGLIHTEGRKIELLS